MASGNYGSKSPSITLGATRQRVRQDQQFLRSSHGFWPNLWVVILPVVGLVLLVVVVGGLFQHPVSSGYLTSHVQTYDMQVGGDKANTWQHDPATQSPTPQATPVVQSGTYSVVSNPSLAADFINQVLSYYHSPAAGKGQALYDLGKQYGIDPGFALAFFMHESSFGTQGEATKSLSLGNIRCIPNYRCEDNFAQFDSWEDGFKAWYQLIRNLYVDQWGLTTVEQIIPRYAPQADNNNEQAYIAALKHAIDTWKSGQIVVK